MRIAPALLGGVMVGLAGQVSAASWVLPYQDDNKWVAASDNTPLIAVMRAARKGTHHFQVRLPKDDRALSVARLEVLRDLLAREAKRGVVIEEVAGPAAKPQTIWVSD